MRPGLAQLGAWLRPSLRAELERQPAFVDSALAGRMHCAWRGVAHASTLAEQGGFKFDPAQPMPDRMPSVSPCCNLTS